MCLFVYIKILKIQLSIVEKSIIFIDIYYSSLKKSDKLYSRKGCLPNDIFAQRSTMLKIVHVITQSHYAFFWKQKTHLI